MIDLLCLSIVDLFYSYLVLSLHIPEVISLVCAYHINKAFKYTTVQVPWYLNHYDLVKQYEVSKNEPEHGTKIDERSRDIAIHRQAIVPK